MTLERARRRLDARPHGDGRRNRIDAYIGNSPASRNVKEMLEKLASVPASAMIITGETGTGKGLIARILHYSGLRRDGPLIETNCAALPERWLLLNRDHRNHNGVGIHDGQLTIPLDGSVK